MTSSILVPRGLALCLEKKKKKDEKKRKKERKKEKTKNSLFCTEIYFYESKVCTVKHNVNVFSLL